MTSRRRVTLLCVILSGLFLAGLRFRSRHPVTANPNITSVLMDVTYESGHGGTSRYIASLADALDSRADIRLFRWRALRFNRLPRLARVPLNGALHLVCLQVALPLSAWWHRADVVHAVMIAPIIAPCPVTLTLFDALDFHPRFRPSALWSAYVRTIGAVAARRADAVITGTRASATEIESAFRLSPTRIHVIPLGGTIAPRSGRPHSHCNASPYVLLVGSDSPRKDFATAIAAVSLVRSSGVDLSVIITGTGPVGSRSHSWIVERQGVDDDTLARLYTHARAVVVPSLHEGFGLPIVEAVAHGVPVVASDIPALREVGGDLILYAVPGQPDSFADQLRPIVVADEASERIEPAAPPLSWEDVAGTTSSVYRSLDRAADDRRTILYVHPSDELYGSDRCLVDAIQGLPRSDRAIVILPTDVTYDRRLSAALLAMGAEVRFQDMLVLRRDMLHLRTFIRPAWSCIAGSIALVSIIRLERVSLVHSNTLAVPCGAIAASISGRPHLWQVHEDISDESPLIRWSYRRLLAILPGSIVANSRATRQSLVADSKTLGYRVHVVPNGVDVTQFALRTSPRESPCPVRIIVVGRLSLRKGTIEALYALRRLTEADPKGDISMTFVGDAPPTAPMMLSMCNELAQRLGITSNVRFLPFSDDVPTLLADHDILLVPSQRPESFGRVILEGMAAGCAVVATRTGGGSDDLIVDGVTGLYADRDPDAIAAALKMLIDDDTLRHAVGKRARDAVIADYSIQQYQTDLLRLYTAACAPLRLRA